MRIASFNVENLFARPKAFSSDDGTRILKAYAEVNELFGRETYSAANKNKMVELLLELDIYRRNDQNAVRRRNTQDPEWAWMRKNRGAFDREPGDTTQDVDIVATGRDDWLGWVELAKEPARELTTRMTAQVNWDKDADVIGVVEAEDRPSHDRFNTDQQEAN
jgi:hypothetical protein